MEKNLGMKETEQQPIWHQHEPNSPERTPYGKEVFLGRLGSCLLMMPEIHFEKSKKSDNDPELWAQ